MTLKCGQSIYSSFSSHRCGRDAVVIAKRLTEQPLADLNSYTIRQRIYCKFHRGVELRRKYSPSSEDDFLPIDAPEAQPLLQKMRAEDAEAAAEAAKVNAEKAAEREARDRDDNIEEWARWTTPATVVAESDDHGALSYTQTDYAWTATRPGDRDWDRPQCTVEVREPAADTPWWHIDPVNVRIRSTQTMTPAQTRAFAECLLAAARKAEEETARLLVARVERIG